MSNKLKNKFARAAFVPNKIVDKEPPISEAHKALLLWEENVDLNKFEWSYLYNYPSGSRHAVIAISYPGHKVEIWFTYMSHFPYKLMVDDKEIFICDRLRDIIKWLDERRQSETTAGVSEGDRTPE